MNLVTLSEEQLLLLRSTLQKQANQLLEDLTDPHLNEISSDLLNDRHNDFLAIIKELDDCKTPKVVKAPTFQQSAEPAWEGTTATAKVLGVEPKKLYNLKSAGKLRPGYHFRKDDKAITWNVATVSQFLSENSH